MKSKSLKELLYKMLGFLSTETYPLTHAGVRMSIAKKSGIVSIDIDSISSLASGSTILGTLPVGWRPKFTAYQLTGEPTGTLNLRMSVSSNGTVNIYNYGQAITSTRNYTMHIVYPTA